MRPITSTTSASEASTPAGRTSSWPTGRSGSCSRRSACPPTWRRRVGTGARSRGSIEGRVLRIVLASQEYPPETAHGGIGTQTHAKAHGLVARGHEVHVLSHSTDGQRHEYRDGRVRVTRIPGVDARLPVNTDPVRWLSYSVEVAAALAALHARTPVDVIDFPEWA